ncbi:MAG: RNA chaperone Hfq [Spirochaetia bacterium]|nr:RNA chaperone Hfq [Spirochaetia bacterium]
MIKNNIQDYILNQARKEKQTITVYLSNGVPLKGKVISFDNYTIIIENDSKQSMIYKHAITTVIPEKSIKLHIPETEEEEDKTS